MSGVRISLCALIQRFGRSPAERGTGSLKSERLAHGVGRGCPLWADRNATGQKPAARAAGCAGATCTGASKGTQSCRFAVPAEHTAASGARIRSRLAKGPDLVRDPRRLKGHA